MEKKWIKKFSLILISSILLIEAAGISVGCKMVTKATSITDKKNQISGTKNQLNQINDLISDLEDEQSLIYERMDDLNADIVNTMTSIGMKEDELAQKEEELVEKQQEITLVQAAYEEAVILEEEQYEAMVLRIRYIYENNNTSLLASFLECTNFSDLLNRADYLQKISDYDKQMMTEYTEAKNQVQAFCEQLEREEIGLLNATIGLEADRNALLNQKTELDRLLAQKKQESNNYDAEIAKAKQEAAAAKKKLQQEELELKQLQIKQQQAGNSNNTSNAANGNYTVTAFDSSVIDNASGSETGKKVAKYACQYIGNPYVSGGTSLTNGADCSGFTYRVYQDFGYTLPRTSYEQRSAGTSVGYDQAQPGDLICYDGHVGIYVGSGYIVHASSVKTGIKVSKAGYRTILDVRRIL
ncbi:NlpC/P60 family protein [Lachnospiraceae bacterium OttesenSCG-928-D06]|nr:NlpC/P60 family protein [Lachnospiraceae bacterium OttesenSCG-928-D06]